MSNFEMTDKVDSRLNQICLLLAPIFVLVVPLNNSLQYYQYPYFRYESILLFLCVALMGLFFGLINHSESWARKAILAFGTIGIVFSLVKLHSTTSCCGFLFMMVSMWLPLWCLLVILGGGVIGYFTLMFFLPTLSWANFVVVSVMMLFARLVTLPRKESRLVRAVILGGCTSFACLLLFNLTWWQLLLCLSITMAFFYSIGVLASQFICIMMGVLLVLQSYPFSSQIRHYAFEPRQDLPPFIHIILDEHIGIAGIPDLGDKASHFKKQLISFLTTNGFSLFPKAYSHYYKTTDSIYNQFNFTRQAQQIETADEFTQTEQARGLRYFQLLSEKGYGLRIYGPAHLAYCDFVLNNLSACMMVNNYNLKLVAQSKLPTEQKVETLLIVTLFHSQLFYQYYQQSAYDLGLPQLERFRLPVVDFSLLSQAQKDIGQQGRGYFYLIHLLAPHYPYNYNTACQPKVIYKSRWMLRRDNYKLVEGKRVRKTKKGNTYASREARYERYFMQAECTMNKLQSFFDVLREQGLYDESIIIIQGDHGSRITRYEPNFRNAHKLSAEDLTDSYSTLYAVKAPQGVLSNDNMLAKDNLFIDTLIRVLAPPPRELDNEAFVYLLGKEDELIKLPITDFMIPKRKEKKADDGTVKQ